MASDTAIADTFISDEMRAVLGRSLRSSTSYPVSASDIRKWALAVYYPEQPPAEFMRVGAAAGEPPLLAPQEFNPFGWATASGGNKTSDGGGPGFLERQAGVAPPDLKFMVNGGMVCEYGVRMAEGDVISNDYSLKSYTVKQGKRGPMLLTETQERWTNQRGEMVRNTVMTLIRY